jgi:hypothetical protein
MTIDPKILSGTITPESAEIVYGDEVPGYSTSLEDSNGETVASLPYNDGLTVSITIEELDESGVPTGNLIPYPLEAGTRLNAGNYLVTQIIDITTQIVNEQGMPETVDGSFNYIVTPGVGSLNIATRSLTITIDNKIIFDGEEVPDLTYAIEGLIEGLSEEDIFGSAINLAVRQDAETGFCCKYEIEITNDQNLVINYGLTVVPGYVYSNPSGPGTRKVKAFLDCVEQVGPGQYIANYRWENPNDRLVFIPRGEDNYISGLDEAAQLLLPEEFEPGFGTFQVPFNGQTILWVLTSFDVSQKSSSTSDASSSSNKCKTKGGGNANNTSNLTIADNRNFVDNYSTYPNPVMDNATVAYLEGEIAVKDVMVLDSQGRMYETTITHNEYRKSIEVDMRQFKAGIYMIRIQNGDTFSILRIIKQ